jgi:hypothetical protein
MFIYFGGMAVLFLLQLRKFVKGESKENEMSDKITKTN